MNMVELGRARQKYERKKTINRYYTKEEQYG